MSDNIEIGVCDWIMSDGNYHDFEVGEKRNFALEFTPRNFEKSDKNKIFYKQVDSATYEINAQIKFLKEDICVIDFGFLAYVEGYNDDMSKNECKEGDFIKGKFFIGIDPFMYYEWHNKIKNIPPLIYSWKILYVFRGPPFSELFLLEAKLLDNKPSLYL